MGLEKTLNPAVIRLLGALCAPNHVVTGSAAARTLPLGAGCKECETRLPSRRRPHAEIKPANNYQPTL